MPTLAFRPDADGFAFTNSFEFDPGERAVLASLTYPLVTAAVTMVSATFSPLLGAAVGLAAAEYVQLGPLPAYGLCGGMCYSALDHWRAHTPLPRGASAGDEPLRGDPAGAPVRDVLWARLLVKARCSASGRIQRSTSSNPAVDAG